MNSFFKNKTLLITGGTGSFGTSITRKFLNTTVKEIRIFSRDEKKQDDMRKKFKDSRLKFIIGDIRDDNSVLDVVEESIIFFMQQLLNKFLLVNFIQWKLLKQIF